MKTKTSQLREIIFSIGLTSASFGLVFFIIIPKVRSVIDFPIRGKYKNLVEQKSNDKRINPDEDCVISDIYIANNKNSRYTVSCQSFSTTQDLPKDLDIPILNNYIKDKNPGVYYHGKLRIVIE